MILNMYSVFDVKSKIYHPPQFCHNQEHALRYFSMQFKDTNSVMAQYPEDFQIFHVGQYDDSTAEIQPMFPPDFTCYVSDIVKKEPVDGDSNDYR